MADGIKCYNNNDRIGFIEFYNDFTKRKNLYTLNLANLEEFSNKEWKYSYAEMNGQILAAHSYLLDNKSGIVRLMESGSLRLNDQYDTSKIAQASQIASDFAEAEADDNTAMAAAIGLSVATLYRNAKVVMVDANAKAIELAVRAGIATARLRRNAAGRLGFLA